VKHPILSCLFFLSVFLPIKISSAIVEVDNGPRINAVAFHCADKKKIRVRITLGEPGSVFLRLSDGRSKRLPQMISASGAKYGDTAEKFVFWNKGDTAFIIENEKVTYRNCVSS
jgi:membrane-bound inhibitor of C-type lysozyme